MTWLLALLKNDCGVEKTDCRFVHLLHEEPAGAHLKPTAKQVATSMPRFRATIEESAPKVIIPMGSEAVRAIMGVQPSKVGIEDIRGYVLDTTYQGKVVDLVKTHIGVYMTSNKAAGRSKGDPKFKMVKTPTAPPTPYNYNGYIIATYSPIQVQKSGYKLMWALRADLDRAVRAANGNLNIINEKLSYYTSLDDAGAREFYAGPMVAFDIETMGIGSRTVQCISFSDGKRTHTIPWNAETRSWVNTQLAIPGILFILHNAAFDIPILRDSGVIFPSYFEYWDSMFAAVVLQPDLSKGLGRVAPLYLDIRAWKWKHLSEANPELYSAMDSFITYWLAFEQADLMKQMEAM